MDQSLERSDSGFLSLDSNYVSTENSKLMTYSKAPIGGKLPNFDILLLKDSQIQTLECDIQQIKQSQYETQSDLQDVKQKVNLISRCISGMEKMLHAQMEFSFMTKCLPIYESKSGKIPVEAETSCKRTAENEIGYDEIYPEDYATRGLQFGSHKTVYSQSVVDGPCFPPHKTIENVENEEMKPFNCCQSKSEKKGFAFEMPVAAVSQNEPENGAKTITENLNIISYENLYNLAPCSGHESTGNAAVGQDPLCLADGCFPPDFVDIKSNLKMLKIPGNPDDNRKKDVSSGSDSPIKENCDNSVSDCVIGKGQIEDSIGEPNKHVDSQMNIKRRSNFVSLKSRHNVKVGDAKKQKISPKKEKEYEKFTKCHEKVHEVRKKKMVKEKKMAMEKKINMLEMKRPKKLREKTQTATKFKQKPLLKNEEFVRKRFKLNNSEVLSFNEKQEDEHCRFPLRHRKGYVTRKKRRRQYGRLYKDNIKKPHGNDKETSMRNGGSSRGIATNVCYPYSTKDYCLMMFLFLAITGVAVASDKNRHSEEEHCSSQYENGYLININIKLPEWFLIVPTIVSSCCMINIHDITNILYYTACDCSFFMVITLMINVTVFWIINHMKTSNCDVTILHEGEIICRRFLPDAMLIKQLITQIEREKLVKGDFYMKTDNVSFLFPDWSIMMIASKEDSRSLTVEIKDTV